MEIDTSVKEFDYIIREYLVHSGYEETFNALEKSAPQAESKKEDMVPNNKIPIDDDKMVIDNEETPEIKKRTLSFMLDRVNDGDEPDIFKIMNFLQERKAITKMINEKDYDNVVEFFIKHFIEYSTTKETTYKKIIICLTTIKYFSVLKTNDYMKAFDVLNKLDRSYWSENLTLNLYDLNDKIIETNIEKLSTLICYQNLLESDFGFYLHQKQVDFLSDQINSLILEMIGLSNESVLEKIMKQQKMIAHTYSMITNSPGERIKVIIN